jgi:integrase
VSKYKRNGKWTIRVPHPYGGVVEKAIGTGNSTVAGNYETMCDLMKSRPQDHLFLVAVCANRLPIRKLYAHWVNKTLDALRAEVTDVDLVPHLAPWRAMLVREYGEPTMAGDTARKYPDQVQSFFAWAASLKPPRHYDPARPIWITSAPLSVLTPERVTQWMAGRDVSSSTELRYWAALKSLMHYLLAMKAIESDPLAKLAAPTAQEPRTRHITPDEQAALIDACAEPFRTAEVLAHMGLEVSAILATRVRDVDLTARTLHAHGTKHRRGRVNYRERMTHIPDWALSPLKAAVRLKHPTTVLVPCTYWDLRKAHAAACESVGLTDYRIHDARHTYAVFMKKAGTPSEVIGLQLGHKDGKQVERVYGRYKPKPEELAHWAEVAERHHKRGAR